jgi:hypothetical protein
MSPQVFTYLQEKAVYSALKSGLLFYTLLYTGKIFLSETDFDSCKSRLRDLALNGATNLDICKATVLTLLMLRNWELLRQGTEKEFQGIQLISVYNICIQT